MHSLIEMPRFLLLDNRDSFTYNLWAWVKKEGYPCRVVTCDEAPEAWETEPWDAAIVGPGPGTPYEAGSLMPFIARYALAKPLLGICLGHQALGLHAGATLIRAPAPMHGKVSTLLPAPFLQHKIQEMAHGASVQGLSLKVMRYHSLVLSQLPADYLLLANAEEDGTLQAMCHQSLPLWGYQFHPESIMTEAPELYLRLFVASLCGLSGPGSSWAGRDPDAKAEGGIVDLSHA